LTEAFKPSLKFSEGLFLVTLVTYEVKYYSEDTECMLASKMQMDLAVMMLSRQSVLLELLAWMADG